MSPDNAIATYASHSAFCAYSAFLLHKREFWNMFLFIFWWCNHLKPEIVVAFALIEETNTRREEKLCLCLRPLSWLPTAWLWLCGLLIHLLDRWRPSRPGLRIVDHLGRLPPPHFTYPRFTLLSPPPHKSLIHSSPAFFFAKCALMCLRRLYQRNRAREGGTSFMWPMQALIPLLAFLFHPKMTFSRPGLNRHWTVLAEPCPALS